MDLRDADDETKTAPFGTGVTWTSWGEHMIAHAGLVADGRRKGVLGHLRLLEHRHR